MDFNALGLNVYKLSFEIFYVARMLHFEKLVLEKLSYWKMLVE